MSDLSLLTDIERSPVILHRDSASANVTVGWVYSGEYGQLPLLTKPGHYGRRAVDARLIQGTFAVGYDKVNS